MKKYVIVKIGGTQYKASEGDELQVDKIAGEKGKSVSFDEVLLLVEEKKVKIGDPAIKGVQVKAKIVEQLKGKKIRVATFKAKSRSRRVKGFRAQLTKIKIEKIASA